MPLQSKFSTTASVFISLRRDESLAPKGIIKGGDWGDGLDDRDGYSGSDNRRIASVMFIDFQRQAPFNSMELDQRWNAWRCIAHRASRKRVTRRKSGGRVYFFNTVKKRISNESTRFIRDDTFSY